MRRPLLVTGRICKEGKLYVGHCDQLVASTSARTIEEVIQRTRELVEIHLEEAPSDGTLGPLLASLGGERLDGVPARLPCILNLEVVEQVDLSLVHRR